MARVVMLVVPAVVILVGSVAICMGLVAYEGCGLEPTGTTGDGMNLIRRTKEKT